MSKFLRAAIVLAIFVVGVSVIGASAAQAQIVGMAGEYSESNGIIVQIPQNPPIIPCTPGVGDARCITSTQRFFGNPAVPIRFTKR